jgi:hypothetical protein
MCSSLWAACGSAVRALWFACSLATSKQLLPSKGFKPAAPPFHIHKISREPTKNPPPDRNQELGTEYDEQMLSISAPPTFFISIVK